MSFYDQFKAEYDTRRQGPPPGPTPPSSPYRPYPASDPVNPDALTVQNPAPPPPPWQPPVAQGNGDSGDDGNRRRRSWGIVGAVIVVVGVIIGVLVLRPLSVTTVVQTPTATTTLAPTATNMPTATIMTAATAIPTTTPVTTCPAPPAQTGSLANMAFFTIPGVPNGSVNYYRSSEDSESNHIQTRILHVCSPGTPSQITQAYATALGEWTACGAQCYQTTFDAHGATLTKSVTVQAAQANGGIATYQLALTLDAALTKTALPFAANANIGFVTATDQDATWLGNGQLQLAPNTFAATASACTAATYAKLHQQQYIGVTTPISISQDQNQPTRGCLKTSTGGLVTFAAYYTTSTQQLILSYTVYVTGFV